MDSEQKTEPRKRGQTDKRCGYVTEDDVAEFRRAWRKRQEGEGVVELAARFGVSTTTFRKHVPDARGVSRAHKGILTGD